MDPFSGEGELLTVTTLFYTQAHAQVIAYDTSPLSPSNRAFAQRLQQRSRIALGQSNDVISSLSTSNDPSSRALKALAQDSVGNEESVATAKELAEQEPENNTVQVLCGTILANAQLYDEAKTLLGKHQGDLEAVALLTQIHLTQNRTDLALKEVQAAKRWAQDSLLINLAEAWVGLRLGGDSYQSSFYVYEELSSSSTSSTPATLTSQAIADMHLNRLPEAEAALTQALDLDPHYPLACANQIILTCLMGKKWPEAAALAVTLKQQQQDKGNTKTTAKEKQKSSAPVGEQGKGSTPLTSGLIDDLDEADKRFEDAMAKFTTTKGLPVAMAA